MLDGIYKKIDQPSASFEYPNVFPEPSECDNAITDFVRANHASLAFIDPPTRNDTFELVRGDQEIIAIASQGIRVYFIAVPHPEQALGLQQQKREGMALRVDYLRIPREMLPTLGEALAKVKGIEIERFGW